jgi:hypothetical protein
MKDVELLVRLKLRKYVSPATSQNIKILNPSDSLFSSLKRENNLIHDIMNRSSWQNLLPAQAETGLITGIDINLSVMSAAMTAVFALGRPVLTGRTMLAILRKFIKYCFPFCGDTVVTLPISHGYAVREHDGAALCREFVLGPSCLVRVILALKLEPELALQTSLRNEAAELG